MKIPRKISHISISKQPSRIDNKFMSMRNSVGCNQIITESGLVIFSNNANMTLLTDEPIPGRSGRYSISRVFSSGTFILEISRSNGKFISVESASVDSDEPVFHNRLCYKTIRLTKTERDPFRRFKINNEI